MKNFTLILSIFFIALNGNAFAQAKLDVSKLTWLTGCWERQSEKSGRKTLEQWTSSTGGALFGIGRTFKNGKLDSWEFMRIEQSGGSAKFLALLSEASEATAFDLRSTTANQLIFENLKNDFPQRVIYKKNGMNKLDARIEGSIDGKALPIEFSFNRVKCDSN